MMQNDGGGSGKVAGGLVLAGMLLASATSGSSSAAMLQLRRGPGEAPVRETERKERRVSAELMVMRVRAREGRKRGQHRVSVVVVYLEHCRAWRKTRAAAALQQRLHPPGGVREMVESQGGVVEEWGEHECGGLYLRPTSGASWTRCKEGVRGS